MMLGIGIGISLGMMQAPVASGVPVTGDPITFTVRDATPFDVLNSKVDNSGVNIGPDGNGWVGELVFKGMSTGGTFDASKVTIIVQDPGFDTSGNATTRTRTLYGNKVLRRQAPNQSTSAIYTSGSDCLVQFAISENIFVGTTILSISVAAGAYGASNAKSSGITLTNNSTLAYPRPLFTWLNMPYERATGTTYNVEGVAMHALARNGQQVAAIAFTATDGTNTTAAVVAGAVSLSSLVTQGHPPECFKAAIPLSSLTQGATCTLAAKVYPWIGDSASVLDLSGADGTAFPTSAPASRLPFVNDKNGTYGGAYACVKAGAGGTPQVNRTLTTARANPYATLGAALTAMQVFNNANSGHNTIGGGTIYMMDNAGVAQSFTLAGNNAAPGVAWCDIKADPTNTAQVTIQGASSAAFLPSMLRYGGGLKLQPDGTYAYFILTNDSTAGQIALDGATWGTTGSTGGGAIGFCRRAWMRNVTFASQAPSFGGTGGVEAPMFNGIVSALAASSVYRPVRTTIGCDMPGHSVAETPVASGSFDSNDGAIFYNNRLRGDGGTSAVFRTENYVKGFAVAQNLFLWQGGAGFYGDTGGTGAGSIQLTISADGAVNSVDNFLDFHNYIVGERGNRLYNDVDASAVAPSGLKKRGVSRFNIWNNWNQKLDCFTGSAFRGRVGGWEYAWGVNALGNVDMYGSKQSNVPGVSEHYLGEFEGQGSLYSAANQGGVPTFVNASHMTALASYDPTNTASDYHLNGATNTAYSRVPAGAAILKYDLDGALRKNDGTGAAGPYER